MRREPKQETIIAAMLAAVSEDGFNAYRCAVDAETLCRIGRAMNRVAETECNFGQTAKTKKRFLTLLSRAESIAADYGLPCCSQRDPRGACLRIGTKSACENGTATPCL